MEVSVFVPYLIADRDKHGGIKPAARAVGINPESFRKYIDGDVKEMRGKNARILMERYNIDNPAPQPPPPAPTTDALLLKAIMDRIDDLSRRVDAQGDALRAIYGATAERQSHMNKINETLDALNAKVVKVSTNLGDELGKIKDRMLDAADSNDLKKLGKLRGGAS